MRCQTTPWNKLHRHLLTKTLNFNVKRSYVGEALDILNKRHEVNVQRAERKAADFAIDLNVANAEQLFGIGDTTSVLQGMQIHKDGWSCSNA